MNDNLTRAFIMLLGGFIVVFSVLLLLIFIVWAYGKIVSSAQSATVKKKQKKDETPDPAAAATAVKTETNNEPAADEIPLEIIAVIAAAVDSLYGTKPHRIKNIKRTGSRSAWSTAGILENTRPF